MRLNCQPALVSMTYWPTHTCTFTRTVAAEWRASVLQDFDRKCRGEASLMAEVVDSLQRAKQISDGTQNTRRVAAHWALGFVHAIALIATLLLCVGMSSSFYTELSHVSVGMHAATRCCTLHCPDGTACHSHVSACTIVLMEPRATHMFLPARLFSHA